MPKLTENFDTQEFNVHEPWPAQYAENRIALAKLAQWLRNLARTPGSITSGFRSPSHNAEVGGVETSQHMRGEAIDIVFPSTPLRVMGQRILQSVADHTAPKFGQVILYADKGHIHLSLPTLGGRNGEVRFSFMHDTDRVYPFLTTALLDELPATTGGANPTTIVGIVAILGLSYLLLRRLA